MPLISRNISNLIGGVSQQPEVLRLDNQATLQNNGFSGVVEGLKKRPPTNYVAKISSGSLSNAFIHTINRDTSERYIVVITNGAISVYTVDGTAKTVVAQTNATNYLTSSSPRTEFKCLTVNDYTYIINTAKTVAMDSSTSTAKVEEAIYQVTQGVNAIDYSVQYLEAEDIDKINIYNATYTAMHKALDGLQVRPDMILVDGCHSQTSAKRTT